MGCHNSKYSVQNRLLYADDDGRVLVAHASKLYVRKQQQPNDAKYNYKPRAEHPLLAKKKRSTGDSLTEDGGCEEDSQ